MRFLLALLLLLVAAPAQAQQGQGISKALVVSSCGGGALPQGAVTNLTMNPQGQLCLVGIAPGGFCAQASAYLLRTTGGNEGGNAANIAALICGLVTDGIITGSLSGATSCGVYLDALYILAQQNAADAVLNLCGTSYSITPTGATFTSYKGYSAFSANGVDTGFNPASSPSPKFVQNSATVGAWAYDVPDAKAQIGTSNTGGGTNLVARYSDGYFYCGINGGNGGTNTSSAVSGIGLFVCERPSAGTVNSYWDGSIVKSSVNPSSPPDSAEMFVGGVLGGALTTSKTISEAHFGFTLGDTLNLALYNRLRTYMTAVGVP